MMDDVDSFARMFPSPPGEEQRARRQARAKKERRSQLTAKQRNRKAVRTAQMNFRCSPEFVALVKSIVESRKFGASIADVLEEAVHLLVEGAKHE